MSVFAGSGSHMGDADLLRYMDRQMDRHATRRARRHVAGCERCAARLAEMERASESVGAWVAELRVEAPDPDRRAAALAALQRARRRRSLGLSAGTRHLAQAAAVVLLMVGFAFGTPPGRTLMGDAVDAISGPRPGPLATRVLEWLGRETDTEAPALDPVVVSSPEAPASAPAADGAGPPPTAAAGAYPPGMSAPVPFSPRGSSVVVHVDSYQRAGTATIRIGQVHQATGQVTAGLDHERLIPTGDGIRIRNSRRSTAEYTVTVPAHFRFVRLRIAGGEEILITASRAKQEWIWTVNLQESAEDRVDER